MNGIMAGNLLASPSKIPLDISVKSANMIATPPSTLFGDTNSRTRRESQEITHTSHPDLTTKEDEDSSSGTTTKL